MTVESWGVPVYYDELPIYPLASASVAVSSDEATERSRTPGDDPEAREPRRVRRTALRDPPPAEPEHQDILGNGMIGLIEAVDRFDAQVGVKFETFGPGASGARWSTLCASRASFRRNTARRVRRLDPTLATLEQELSRAPTTAEIASRLGLSEQGVRSALVAGPGRRRIAGRPGR